MQTILSKIISILFTIIPAYVLLIAIVIVARFIVNIKPREKQSKKQKPSKHFVKK
jgi:hypothetical protein